MKYMRAIALPQSSKFAITVALGAKAPRFISQVNTWLSESGAEWTVKRLKTLRTAALLLRGQYGELYRNGKPLKGTNMVRSLYQENSIAYHRSTLLPKGICGDVVGMFVRSRKPSVTRRLDVVLRCYTSIFLQQTSWSQFKKAEKAINSKPSFSDEGISFGRSFVTKGWLYFKELLPRSVFDEEGNVRVGNADLRDLHPYTACHTSDRWRTPKGDPKVVEPYARFAASFCSTTAWPKAFRTDYDAAEWTEDWKGIYPYEIFDFTRSMVWNNNVDNDYIGHIGFLQNAGAKGRIVAVANGKVQWGFAPLHKSLDNILRHLQPWFCVHDQNNGAYYLLDQLGHREVIGSIDLSSATDRFPAELQYTLLREMGLSDWISAYQEVCADDWKAVTPDGEVRVWHYECGQPMGLYSSFPLFSLTYGCFVMGLYLTLREQGFEHLPKSPEETFRNLGDDIIVKTSTLCKYMTHYLSLLGVPISYDKTFLSRSVGEFAGFIALGTNRGVTAYRPYKHSGSSGVRNGVGFLHAVGRAVYGLPAGKSRKYWVSKYSLFKRSLPWRYPDLSPIVDVTEQKLVPNEELVDVPRLANLLNANLLSNPGIGNDPFAIGNSWTGERFEISSIEDICYILLNQEMPDDDFLFDREPLSAGLPVEESRHRDNPYGQSNNITTDPLLSESILDMLDPVTEGPSVDSVQITSKEKTETEQPDFSQMSVDEVVLKK